MKTNYQRNEKTLLLYNLTSHNNTTTDQEDKALLKEQIDCLPIIHQPNYPEGKLKVWGRTGVINLPLRCNGPESGEVPERF
nr:hypothetical protein CFP56_79176 [Quercus suber]